MPSGLHGLHRLVPATLTLLLTFGAMTVGAPTWAGAASPEERRLQQMRREIKAVGEQIEATSEALEDDQRALAQAKQQVARVVAAVASAELAVQRQEQAVTASQERLVALRRDADLQQRVASDRVVELYKQGTGAPLGAVLAAQSPHEAVQRSAFMDVVVRADRRALQELAASKVAVEAERADLEREEQALQEVLVQQQSLLADVERLRTNRAIVLADTENRLADLRAEERHLESEGRELTALIERSSGSAAASRGAGRGVSSGGASSGLEVPAAPPSTGGWSWPASGPVTSPYGWRWGRMHEGIDIGAPTGAPIVAARAGTVSFAGAMSGYGNLVLVDHGGGIVTAYAHQSAIGVSLGQQVAAGQRIGAIGCTGSCTGPHLHFEVRVGGVAHNPMAYLP